ncbi:PREDICTED: protein GLUTAMINE DUMPER 7-like [Camelina sativa]|uniref:Protein GLUTAMINE DUMPER 7-like n=1 Tax=Camelina sativa TaxID=90675 RepID=A0ABM1QIG3_CAMSA|nr:PREDICTED: protein GLUTAMINE DUMPER 7-like [Camelina sativa]
MSLDSSSMVPVNSGLENLNSPVLSKICAWGVMFGLFAVSLIAMAYACYHKQNASNSCIEEQEKQGKKQVLKPLDMEPKIVVIMASNDNPTFLAKPTKINA